MVCCVSAFLRTWLPAKTVVCAGAVAYALAAPSARPSETLPIAGVHPLGGRSALARRPRFLAAALGMRHSVGIWRLLPAPAMRQAKLFGHRVVAAVAQRLAAQYSPQREHAATPWPEARHRNPCIIRATRMKATVRHEQGTEPALVQMEQAKYQSRRNIHGAEQLAADNVVSIPEASLPVQDTWVITPGRHGQ